MKILVTGDRGYIGSTLVPLLLKKKYQVVGLDTNFFKKNLDHKASNPYKKITKDIRDIEEKDLKGIDAVIHLGALSNDPMGEINPGLTEKINFNASIRLAKLAKKVGVSRFLFSSSCSIYGIAKDGIVDEKSPVNPLTAYAKSKIDLENELVKLADDKFCVGLLRNSTVYGYSPKFRNDLVVNNFVTTAIAFGQIRVMSDGTPWRPLIDVRDLSNAFIAFLEADSEKINGKIINIGFDENNFQVKDLLDEVKKQLPHCDVVYTGEHGKDSRSYKVKFDLFHSLFPELKQKWTLSKSVKDLITHLKSAKFGKKEFESGKYSRIGVLKRLVEEGKVDKQLRVLGGRL
jgi:nucleoside-diphosphate-sugar epimerase